LGLVVVEEQACDQFATGADAHLVEDRLEVILDGVGGEVQTVGDVVGRVPLGDELRYESFPVGEAVGGGNQWCVVLPADGQLEPFVDADDIADVAVAVLTDDRHIGEVYELTSPRLLTFAGAVAEIAKVTGRDIRYVPISVEAYAASAAEHGVPGEFVGFLTHLFSDVLGRNAYVTDGVQRALGREPTDFGDFVRGAAASGAWNAG
jgi:hypothetical protein